VWPRLRSVHRRVIGLVALSVLLGVGVGVLFGLGQFIAGAVTAALLALLVVPWLSFVGTWRILGPMRRLARVADELGRGRLDARDDIDVSDEEVAPVATALQGMAERISRQLDDQRALMGAVSHELRSPLARARILVEMSREGTAPDDLADQLEEEIAAMDGIVGDLLAASRIDFEALQRVRLEPVDVAYRAVDAAGVPRTTLDIRPDLPALEADPTLLVRALGVLLTNAATHGGGVASVGVLARDDEVAFTVLDDGPGFAPGDEARAFEPFWRAGGEGAPRGEGLGLALVRRIAEAHGGTATAGNRASGGAWVRIALPSRASG